MNTYIRHTQRAVIEESTYVDPNITTLSPCPGTLGKGLADHTEEPKPATKTKHLFGKNSEWDKHTTSH